jgi:hypothetical protein
MLERGALLQDIWGPYYTLPMGPDRGSDPKPEIVNAPSLETNSKSEGRTIAVSDAKPKLVTADLAEMSSAEDRDRRFNKTSTAIDTMGHSQSSTQESESSRQTEAMQPPDDMRSKTNGLAPSTRFRVLDKSSILSHLRLSQQNTIAKPPLPSPKGLGAERKIGPNTVTAFTDIPQGSSEKAEETHFSVMSPSNSLTPAVNRELMLGSTSSVPPASSSQHSEPSKMVDNAPSLTMPNAKVVRFAIFSLTPNPKTYIICNQALQIPNHVHTARAETIRRIQRVIQQRYGRQYRVELFGSTRYGVSSPKSDLDLVIIVSRRFYNLSCSITH